MISIISFNRLCKHDIKKLHLWFENKNLNVQHSQKKHTNIISCTIRFKFESRLLYVIKNSLYKWK